MLLLLLLQMLGNSGQCNEDDLGFVKWSHYHCCAATVFCIG